VDWHRPRTDGRLSGSSGAAFGASPGCTVVSTERTVYPYHDMSRNAAEMPMGQIAGTGAGLRTFVLFHGTGRPWDDGAPTGVPYEAA